MVLAALTEYPELWKVGVEFYGIANFLTMLETTGPWRKYLRAVEYGDPVADRDDLIRFSPIHKADRIRVPLLIAQGLDDPRVPPGESEMVYSVLRGLGHPVDYVRIPHEGHGFARIENRRTVFGARRALSAQAFVTAVWNARGHPCVIPRRSGNWSMPSGSAFEALSDRVWGMPEIAYTEYRSVAEHTAMLKEQGFRVTENVAGIPTAVMGEAGEGGPVIAILGEYDALPGLSQEANIAEPRPVDGRRPRPWLRPQHARLGRPACRNRAQGLACRDGARRAGALLSAVRRKRAGQPRPSWCVPAPSTMSMSPSPGTRLR